MFNIGERASRFVKIWDNVTMEEKYTKFKASTSRKDTRNEGQYINSNWLVTFVGNAKEKSESLQNGDVIKIINGGVENNYNKDQDKTYINVTVFDFEFEEGYGNTQPQDTGSDDSGKMPWE